MDDEPLREQSSSLREIRRKCRRVGGVGHNGVEFCETKSRISHGHVTLIIHKERCSYGAAYGMERGFELPEKRQTHHYPARTEMFEDVFARTPLPREGTRESHQFFV